MSFNRRGLDRSGFPRLCALPRKTLGLEPNSCCLASNRREGITAPRPFAMFRGDRDLGVNAGLPNSDAPQPRQTGVASQ